MAINGNNRNDILRASLEDAYTKNHLEIFEWEPTGEGLMVTSPGLKATSLNANGVLSVRGAQEDNARDKLYLFIDRVTTSWAVSGGYAQSVLSRTWIPRSLVMSDLTITGQVANQHEYDLLVKFVRDNMRNSLVQPDIIYEDNISIQVPYLEFKMFEPGISHQYAVQNNVRRYTYNHIPNAGAARRIHMYVMPINVAAGHERFKFSPAFTLTCKVLWDSGDPDADRDVVLSTMRELDYQQIFGVLHHPTPEGPELNPSLPTSTYTGSSRSGTGAGGGGGDFSGNTPPVEYAETIAAHAPDLTDKIGGPSLKAAAPGPKFPEDPNKQYFAAMANNGFPGTGNRAGKINVKYRDPPSDSNTIWIDI